MPRIICIENEQTRIAIIAPFQQLHAFKYNVDSKVFYVKRKTEKEEMDIENWRVWFISVAHYANHMENSFRKATKNKVILGFGNEKRPKAMKLMHFWHSMVFFLSLFLCVLLSLAHSSLILHSILCNCIISKLNKKLEELSKHQTSSKLKAQKATEKSLG